jgi:hypothetical protein
MQTIRINKHNIQDQWFNIIISLPAKLQLGNKDFNLLLEAFRRKHLLKSEEKFLGLGCPSDYKSKLFQASFGKLEPRVANWFTLTELGKEKMKELEEILVVEPGSESVINEVFFANS